MFESLFPTSKILSMMGNRKSESGPNAPVFKTEVITSTAPFEAPKAPTLEAKAQPNTGNEKVTPKQDLDQLAQLLGLDLSMVSEEVTAPPAEKYEGPAEFNLDLVLQNLQLDTASLERVKLLDAAPFDRV